MWDVRDLPGGLGVEPRAGDVPALVLSHGADRVCVKLAHVKGLMADLVDGAADLAEVLGVGGV